MPLRFNTLNSSYGRKVQQKSLLQLELCKADYNAAHVEKSTAESHLEEKKQSLPELKRELTKYELVNCKTGILNIHLQMGEEIRVPPEPECPPQRREEEEGRTCLGCCQGRGS